MTSWCGKTDLKWPYDQVWPLGVAKLTLNDHMTLYDLLVWQNWPEMTTRLCMTSRCDGKRRNLIIAFPSCPSLVTMEMTEYTTVKQQHERSMINNNILLPLQHSTDTHFRVNNTKEAWWIITYSLNYKTSDTLQGQQHTSRSTTWLTQVFVGSGDQAVVLDGYHQTDIWKHIIKKHLRHAIQ